MQKSFEYLKNVKEIDQTLWVVDKAEERGFPQNEEQSQKWIETYVQYNLAYLTQRKKYAFEDARQKLLQERMKNYEKRMKKDTYDTVSYFINSFNASVDPHSHYYSPEGYKEFNDDMRLSFEGIGARLTRDEVSGVSMIVEVIKDGPAFQGGLLKPFDEIIGVKEADQAEFTSVVGMDLSDVIRLIKGPKDSQVVLQVRRSANDVVEVLPIPIMRGKVKTNEEEAVLYYETIKGKERELLIGVIHLPSFYRDFEGFSRGDKTAKSCATDVEKLLEQAKLKKVDGIILDLQNNSGGSLTDAISIAGLFINKGVVVVTKDNKDKEHIRNDPDGDISYEGPLVVLINRRSASASEIVSGALKDYRRALILGDERTFGKGTVQEIFSLGQDKRNKDLGAIKITINQFFTAGGNSTQWEGVTSDIRLPSYFDATDVGERRYKEALPFEKISSYVDDKKAGEGWSRITAEAIEALKEGVLKRIAISKELKKIEKNVEKANAKKTKENILRVADLFSDEEKDDDEDNDDHPTEFPLAWFKSLTSKDRQELYKKVEAIEIFPSKNFGAEENSSDYLVVCFNELLAKKNLNDILPRGVKHNASLDSQRLIKEIATLTSKENHSQDELMKLNKKLLREYYPELKGPFQNSTFVKEGLFVMADLVELGNKEVARVKQNEVGQ